MNTKRFMIFSVLFLTILLLTSCTTQKINEEKPYTRSEFAMDTLCNITIFENNETALNHAFEIIADIEDRMSHTVSDNEISQINSAAGKSPIKVSKDTFYVIKTALDYSKLTEGKFDISIAPIVDLWNINSENPKIPSKNELNHFLPLVNWNEIILDETNQTVFLAKYGMKIDLGGIAKGYAADAIADYFETQNISRAIINLGGNVFAFGEKIDGTPWNIGIQDPTTQEENAIASVQTSKNTAIVTSGIYQRYFEQDGKIYHHILNPFDGYPIDNNLLSVTVLTDKSIKADALSTSMFALGIENGLRFINATNGVEAVFIDTDNNIYLSDGIMSSFHLIDEQFHLIEQ